MSTPEQPMTRKQRRELERTGALQIPTDDSAVEADVEPEAEPVAPLPRAAESSATPSTLDDEEIDLDARPLTRRQARLQERLRTASMPVITPEEVAASADARTEAEGGAQADAPAEANAEAEAQAQAETDVQAEGDAHDGEGVPIAPGAEDVTNVDVPADFDIAAEAQAEPEVEPEVELGPALDADAAAEIGTDADADAHVAAEADAEDEREHEDEYEDEHEASIDADTSGDVADADEAAGEESLATVGPQFGAALLAGDGDMEVVDLPPSFDEIIARNASSTTSSTPSALILSQAPTAPSLGGPIAATGELIVTGSYSLPEGLGSTGVPKGATDGREVDAVLIDGELPAASSPTPVAASAAVSTSRGADEVIRPPVPEKGGRLILALAITAGVLAIAVVGVLVVALVNGVLA